MKTTSAHPAAWRFFSLTCGLGLSGLLTAATPAEPTETHELDAYVVTATRTEQPMRTAPASISLLTSAELSTGAAPDLLGSIRDVSGLNLVGRGVGGRKVLLLRGMESRHSLILVDGRRVSSTDDVVGHSDFQYDWVPANVIDRIEIIRGPMSALYGSEAMGGVINILTKAVPDAWTYGGSLLLDAREDGRGGDLAQFSLNAAGPVTDALGARLNVLYRYLDDTPTAADDSITELEGADLRSANLTLGWKMGEAHRFDFSWNYSDEERWRQTASRSGVNYLSSYDLLKQQIGLRWRPQLGAWSGQVGAYQTTIDVENHATEGQSPSEPQYLTDRIADFDFSRFIGERHELTLGGELRDENLEHASFEAGERSALHKALFAQDRWELTDALALTAAGRWDHHELFGSHFTPRAYLVWQPSEHWVIKGGYGAGFKAPTLKQISPEYKFVGPHTFLGNADLEPESSDSWELGVLWEPSREFSVSVTGFHNEITDLITSVAIENVTAPRGRIYKYFNVEEAEVTGVETELTWRPVERLFFRFNHTWLDAEDVTNDRPLPSRPEHRLNASAHFDFLPEILKGGLTYETNGEQWEIASTGEELAMPAYSLVSTWLKWTVSEAHSLVVGVHNLGDVDLAAKSDAYGYAERGRSYYLRWNSQF